MTLLRAAVAVLCLVAASACDRSHQFQTPELQACDPGQARKEHLKVVSFNIRSGLSSSIEDIGHVIEQLDPDVVALQEVDVGVERTHRVNQAALLAERLGASYVFAGAIKREGGDYGVALLSRLPVATAERLELGAPAAFEPRVAIKAGVCVNGSVVDLVALHADVFPWSAGRNTEDLGKRLTSSLGQGLVVAGDLNETPDQGAVKTLTDLGLVDVLKTFKVGATFPGNGNRIDYILADSRLAPDVTSAGAVDATVSDHLPVFAQFDLPQPTP